MPDAADTPDADLLARFRAGDDVALGRLFERYEGPVFRFLLGVLRDHHRAEDALQETFVQALRHADAADPIRFRGWLFAVAHQQAMLLLRKEKRVPATSADALLGLVDSAAAPTELAGRADDVRAVGDLLARLPAGQQAVIRLRVFEGLTFREVADKLGCPLNTALGRMHDGLKTLRNLLSRQPLPAGGRGCRVSRPNFRQAAPSPDVSACGTFGRVKKFGQEGEGRGHA